MLLILCSVVDIDNNTYIFYSAVPHWLCLLLLLLVFLPDAEQSVAVDSMKIPMPEQLLQTDEASDAWSVHKNVIALVTGTSTVR